MNRYEKIQTLCKQRGISIRRLETDLEMSNGYIGKMKSSKPNAEAVVKIAKYFQVPVEALEDDKNLSRNQRFIYSDLFSERPLYRAAAGEGAFNDTFSDQTVSVGDADSKYEFVEIVGDSMLPILQSGDIVKVEITTEVSPRDFALVKINGNDACVKYAEIVSDGLWLRAENKSVYQDRFFSIKEILNEPVTILGKAVEVRRAL